MTKKYIHPFELDEALYPIGVLSKSEDGKNCIEIKMLKRNQFPSSIVKSHFNKLLNYGYIQNFHCFYTGIHCWLSKVEDDILIDEKFRFRLTKEHISSVHIGFQLGLENKVQHPSNIIGVSSYFNYKLGHIPLVLKLWLKKKLEQIDYSRTVLTKENSHRILRHIINLQDLFLYKGLYPWQPQKYLDKNSKKISQSIFDEMTQTDREFLLISNVRDSFQWLKEYNPAWIEKFYTAEPKHNKNPSIIVKDYK